MHRKDIILNFPENIIAMQDAQDEKLSLSPCLKIA